jgi:transcription factor SFP1
MRVSLTGTKQCHPAYKTNSSDSPTIPFSTSITMAEPSQFASNAASFQLPSIGSSSYQRRSYAAAAAAKRGPNALSSSFASMSFQPMSLGTSYNQPMSFGTSYSKGQVHSLMATRSDAELTKAYECCGQTHSGLHALLEHVEDAHPFNDPDVDANVGFTPMIHSMELDMDGVDIPLPTSDQSTSSQSSISPNPVPNYPLPPSVSKPSTPTEPTPASFKISDVLTSPPDISPIQATVSNRSTSTCSSPPDLLSTPTTSTQPSPVFATPKIASRTGFHTRPAAHVTQKHFDRAFNEVVAGRKEDASKKIPGPTAVAPGVLFASTLAGMGIPTTPPVPGTAETPVSIEAEASGSKITEPVLPQPSLFTTHKPWRCPNPGCNKAYKQSNGLKYHQQKG